MQAVGLRPDDEVLVPAHHHRSAVEALRQAGLQARFYEGGSSLEPDADELETLLGPRVRALYLVHYLGFPQDARRWRAWCDERGLRLLEDATHALLSTTDEGPVGTFGDLSVFSLSRPLGLPDGAALVVRGAPAPGPELGRRLGAGTVASRHLEWLLNRYALSGARSVAGSAEPAGEEVPVLADPDAAPSAGAVYLLPRVAGHGVAGRRRANYAALLEHLGELVPPPFDQLPAGASPFALPIETESPDELVGRLTAKGISAEDLWASPHPSLQSERFPRAARRRQRTVLLPVHQGLGPAEVGRIAEAVRGRRRPSRPDLRVEPLESLDALGAEWNELAARSRNVFATAEWLSTWWRHFGRERPLLVLACRDRADRLVALLPLYLASTAPVRVLRFLGHGPGDQLGPICAPGDRTAAAAALRSWLARPPHRWDVLVGQQLPEDEGWGALLGARALAREGSPVLRFHGRDWDELLASLSYGLRKEIRAHERKLAKKHDLHFRLADDPARLEEDLDLLFRLHGQQWTEGTSAFGPHEAFHREFATLALRRGWLRLWFLEIDGKPAAAKYNLRLDGVEFSYQAGRDPDWRRSSVGLVILAHAIRTAVEEGVGEYRFLRGGEKYKYRLANADPGLETLVLGGGPSAAGAVAASRVLRRSERLGALRDRLPG